METWYRTVWGAVAGRLTRTGWGVLVHRVHAWRL